MEYKIEDISPVSKKIVVTVPAEEVNGSLAATIAMYKVKADIHGFRKGKAPGSVVEQQFRKQIYGEATTDLINVHINEILAEIKLSPLSKIDVDAEEFVRDQDFVYSFSFELAPAIELPDYVGVAVEEEKAEASPEVVAKVESRILDNMAEVKIIEDVRHPVEGDVVTVTFGVYEGDTILDGIKADNFEIQLGQNQALPEFEELVKELKQGENGNKDIQFPDDFINTRLAGKKATIKATLHAIKERRVPEMNDEVAKKVGYEDMEKLRAALTESYLVSRKNLYKAAAQKKLVDSLLAQVEFPLPPSLVESRLDMLLTDLAETLEKRGKSLESLGKSIEQLRDEHRPRAVDMARTELFLLAVAGKEGLAVSPQEIDAVLKRYSDQTGQNFFELKRHYEESGLVIPLKDRILADKAMEFIYSKAQVTEVPAKEEAAA
jgi:trigger factor